MNETGDSADRSKEEKSQLHARISPALLARVNAMAALSEMSQQDFVIECLEEATVDVVDAQKIVQRKRKAKEKKKLRGQREPPDL
jgi:uncharacterized protein (DUF1778 family)